MRHYHYYHEETGVLHNSRFSCDDSTPHAEKDAEANAPVDHKVYVGKIEAPWLVARVDVKTGSLVRRAVS